MHEWLIETVMATYEFNNRPLRVNNTPGNKFSVKVGVHQGPVLSFCCSLWFLKHHLERLEVDYCEECSMQMIL